MLKIFSPPIFQDSESSRKAKVFNSLVIVTDLILTTLLLILSFILPQNLWRWVTLLAIYNILSIGVLFLNRKGYTKSASFAFIGFTMAIVFGLSWTAGGITSGSFRILPVLILAGGLTLGWRNGIIVGLVSILGALGFVLADSFHVLPTSIVTQNSWGVFFNYTAMICLLIILQYFSVALLDKALQEAKEELLLRTNTEDELRKSEAFRKRVFESSRVPIVVMDSATFKYIDCNRAAVDIYRFPSREETIGKSPMDFSAPEQYDGASSLEKAQSYIKIAMEEGSVVFNWKHQRPDGEFWDAEVHLMSFEMNNKKLLQFTMLDISERMKTEAKLKQSEERYKSLIENTPDILARFDKNVRYLFINSAIKEASSLQPDEFIGKTMEEVGFSKEQADKRESIIREVFKKGKPSINEFEFVGVSGRQVYEWRVNPEINSLGMIESVLTINRNITERKRAEEALQESEIKYHTLYDTASDSIFLMVGDKIIDCNTSTLEMFGCNTMDQIIGNSPMEFSPEVQSNGLDSNELGKGKIEAALSGQKQFFEWSHKKLDGTLFPAEVSLNRVEIGEKVLLQAIVRDITERKQAEESLRKSEEKFAKAFNTIQEAISITSVEDGKYIEMNDAFLMKTGFQREELIGHSAVEFNFWVNFEERERFYEELTKHGKVRNFEAQYRMRNNEIRDSLISSVFIELAGKKCALNFMLDITERKHAEEELNRYKDHLLEMVEERTSELEESRETFRALAENTKDVITRVNDRFQFLYVNSSIADVFGISTIDYIGKTLEDLNFDKTIVTEFENIIGNVFETKENRHGEFQLPNGVWADILAMPEFDMLGNVCSVIISARDITEIKKLQLEFQEALEKEKELNQLKNRFISMVSHEYRTPLTSILSSSEILEMGDEKYSKEKKKVHFDRIQKNVDYLINMIDEVLFVNRIDSKRVTVFLEKTNVANFCSENFDEIKELYPEIKSHIEINLEEEFYNIDTTILRKILMNLVSNAYKYNKENGQVNFIINSEMDKLIFRICDTGIGIPDEEQKNVFEPFSRMSNTHNIKGTGLGLSIVKKSVEQLEGTISFASKKDEGTTFTVTIPIH